MAHKHWRAAVVALAVLDLIVSFLALLGLTFVVLLYLGVISSSKSSSLKYHTYEPNHLIHVCVTVMAHLLISAVIFMEMYCTVLLFKATRPNFSYTDAFYYCRAWQILNTAFLICALVLCIKSFSYVTLIIGIILRVIGITIVELFIKGVKPDPTPEIVVMNPVPVQCSNSC